MHGLRGVPADPNRAAFFCCGSISRSQLQRPGAASLGGRGVRQREQRLRCARHTVIAVPATVVFEAAGTSDRAQKGLFRWRCGTNSAPTVQSTYLCERRGGESRPAVSPLHLYAGRGWPLPRMWTLLWSYGRRMPGLDLFSGKGMGVDQVISSGGLAVNCFYNFHDDV